MADVANPEAAPGRAGGRGESRAEPGFSRTDALALGAILAVAAWLRVVGLAFGLPAVYNPDEVAIVSRALAFATGDLNPHNFLYPTFFFYLLFGWLGAYFVAAWALGAVPSLHAFQTQFFLDPSGIYLAARVLGVACGVGGVLATWWLARRLFGRSVALVAAMFLAVAPTAVRDAHYVKHDVPVTLAIVLAMIAIARAWPLGSGRPRTRSQEPGADLAVLAVAGATSGVAFSTHYYAVFLAAPLALASWWGLAGRPARKRAAAVLVAGAAMGMTFLALSPFLLVEPGTAWRDVVANRHIVVDRSGAAAGWWPSAPAYARMLWTEAIGAPVVLLATWGAWAAWRLSARVGAWLLAFPVVFLLFIANTVAASRYLNPVLPFLALLAALAVHDLAARLWPRRRPAVVVVLGLLAAVPGARASWLVGRFFGQEDTRTLGQRYVERHVPAGSTVLLQPYSVQLVQSRAGLLEALAARLGDPSRASTKFALRLRLDPWPAPAYRTLYLGEGGLDADKIYLSYREFEGPGGADRLRGAGVQYVVLKRYNVADPATAPLRLALERAGRLVATVSPYRLDAGPAAGALPAPFLHNTDTPLDPALERPGPIIDIWAVQ